MKSVILNYDELLSSIQNLQDTDDITPIQKKLDGDLHRYNPTQLRKLFDAALEKTHSHIDGVIRQIIVLMHGDVPQLKGSSGVTLLYLAARLAVKKPEAGYQIIVDILARRRGSMPMQALQDAVDQDDLETLKLLCRKLQIDIAAYFRSALEANNVAAINALLRAELLDSQAVVAALLDAIAAGEVDAARTLVKATKGFDIRPFLGDEGSLLCRAALAHQLAVAKMLVEEGEKVTDDDVITVVAEKRDLEAFKILMQVCSEEALQHYCDHALRMHNAELAGLILDVFQVNFSKHVVRLLQDYMLLDGKEAEVVFLLHMTKINVAEHDEKSTWLQLALLSSKYNVAAALVNAGAKVNELICTAVDTQDEQLIQVCLRAEQEGRLVRVTEVLNHHLFDAALKRQPAKMRFLLAHGAQQDVVLQWAQEESAEQRVRAQFEALQHAVQEADVAPSAIVMRPALLQHRRSAFSARFHSAPLAVAVNSSQQQPADSSVVSMNAAV